MSTNDDIKRQLAERSGDTYTRKLAEEHTKFYERAKARKSGSYTADETGARGLALQRLQYFLRQYDKKRKAEHAFRRGREIA